MDFLICSRSGVHTSAQMGISTGFRGIVNINAIPLLGLADMAGKNYDGELEDQRSRRREAGWMPVQL